MIGVEHDDDLARGFGEPGIEISRLGVLVTCARGISGAEITA